MKIYFEDEFIDILQRFKSVSQASRTNKTIADVFNNMNEFQKDIAYEMIGQALELGDYDREALVMFNKEERIVIDFLLNQAMKGE